MDVEVTAKNAPARRIGRSILLTVPVALWGMLMFTPTLRARSANSSTYLAAVVTIIFMTALFFMMMRTGKTYRWRRIFFVTLAFLFPIGFIAGLIAERGSMNIPIEQMIAGNTPFCYLAIPMLIIPAALTKTIIFPGTILPTASNGAAIGTMIALWFGATLVLGKAWCGYGCFFGGIEEGLASIPRRPKLKKIDGRWRYVPWAVLLAVILLSAALFEPVYCMWLCPFKAVTEYPEVRNLEAGIQFGIFSSIFAGLVIVLPLLTKKRTQCAFFCPFGAFQSLFEKLNIFDIRIKREKCSDCVLCRTQCPTVAIDAESVHEGKTLISCMRCGACVDTCPKQAAVWHIKGTGIDVNPERARLMFLYGAWAFATMFGGSIIANSLRTMFEFVAGRFA